MIEKLTIESKYQDATVHWRRGCETWDRAADRAVRKIFGRGASAFSWREDSCVVNRNGETQYFIYRATVVGRRTRDGSWPVLGEVTTRLGGEL